MGSGKNWLCDLVCEGTEASLADCGHSGWAHWGNGYVRERHHQQRRSFAPWTDTFCARFVLRYHDDDVGMACTFTTLAKECVDCEAGKYSDGENGLRCVGCAAGSHSSTARAASCEQVRNAGGREGASAKRVLHPLTDYLVAVRGR